MDTNKYRKEKGETAEWIPEVGKILIKGEYPFMYGDRYKMEKSKIIEAPRPQIKVYHKDIGEYNWDDAIKACEDLGDGWVLPDRLELLAMYMQKDEIGGFANIKYWSSTEFDYNYGWIQNFFNSFQYNYFKNSIASVRPIKHIGVTLNQKEDE